VITPVLGKPLVQYIWEQAQKSKKLSEVIVAVDSEDVLKSVEGFGGRAVMTPSHLPSGSDRVAFVAKDCDADIIINLQADEPLLEFSAIDDLVECFEKNPQIGMATLVVKKNDLGSLEDPNTVKCVVSSQNEALYFSRKALCSNPQGGFFKHIGIYGYKKETLFALAQLPPSSLELTEKLEQLRALENGIRIGVCEISQETISVDTPSDLERVERFLRAKLRSGLNEN
jgi:3-deoxy-manno-octulosonate cytidylyltransferase (CMP-KDO synthetase)